MQIGSKLYAMSKRRRALIVSLCTAIIVCVCVLYRPSFAPPGLHKRDLTIGAASTEIIVETPGLPVGYNSVEYATLVNRATLIGNVMVSPTVLTSIGNAIGVPWRHIQATAPMTANVPRALIDPGSGGSATSIIASPDHYKLEIQADPSVPILHIYTQAPTSEQAITFANASVTAVTQYLRRTQLAGGIKPSQWVQVEQLGTAAGGTANPGAPAQIVALVFVGVFGITFWLVWLVATLRRGWIAARLADRPLVADQPPA